jgi:hypothetical protein
MTATLMLATPLGMRQLNTREVTTHCARIIGLPLFCSGDVVDGYVWQSETPLSDAYLVRRNFDRDGFELAQLQFAPLTDDGDALLVAAKLSLTIQFKTDSVKVGKIEVPTRGSAPYYIKLAMREAICLSAMRAEI